MPAFAASGLPAPAGTPACAADIAAGRPARDGDRAVLASDVHLGIDDPATAEAFLAQLPRVAAGADRLLLLGDLFDAWIGDDVGADPAADAAHEALAQRAIGTLARIADTGCAVGIARGNRDFLLGERFARACGAELLPEQAVVLLAGEPALLTHGDELCTGDTAYQQFRAQVRDPAWQAAFLGQPRHVRLAVARRLRGHSDAAKRDKPEHIMDVDPEAVRRALRAHGVRRLVHGHTHRPATHAFELDGAPAERRVLPDWHAAERRGGFLVADAHGWHEICAFS